jgi:membrane protein required for colicin V production
MQSVDIAILVVVALPAIAGVMYGFLNIIFSLLAWALALGISIKFSPAFTPLLESSVNTPVLRTILAFVGLFVISLLILTGVGFLIVKLLGRTGLTAADRILGLFFGVGLGAIIVEVVVFLGGFTALPQEPWWNDSRVIKPFERVALWSGQYLPENISKYHGYDLATEETVDDKLLEINPPVTGSTG